MQKSKTGPLHFIIQKLTKNGFEDLNVRPQTIKTVEENLGNTILDIGIGKEYMTKSSKAIATEQRPQNQHHTSTTICLTNWTKTSNGDRIPYLINSAGKTG